MNKFVLMSRTVVVMKKSTVAFAGLSALLAGFLAEAPAQAQVLRTWVSATGGGSACTRAAPCANFQAAHDATISGGEINCVDAGDFNFQFATLTLSKTITIDCAGTLGGHMGVNIHVAGDGITVRLRNLTLQGLGVGSVGVFFINGAALYVENCAIFGNRSSQGAGTGILFTPPTGVAAKLFVTDSIIGNNGVSGSNTGGGIVIRPQGSGVARVALERVTVNGNAFGIAADGTGSTSGINMTIADSMVSGNSQYGIIATTPAGGAPIGVMVKNTKSVNNIAVGIGSFGPNVTVRVDGSTVTGNGTGLSFGSGGALLTFGNNAVQANGNNGAFSGSVGLQ